MQTTYRLNANELTPDFIESVKTLFGSKAIEIIVMEAPLNDANETNESTEYLFGDAKRREYLLKLINEVERGENLVTVPMEKLEKML
jgi:hypothetical protein